MSIAELAARKLGELPVDRQMEVLDFIEYLQHKTSSRLPLRDPEGMFADLQSDLSFEDFQEARREAWKNFPREIE